MSAVVWLANDSVALQGAALHDALQAVGFARHRLIEGAREIGLRSRPVRDHGQTPAVVGDDRHAVVRPEAAEVGLEPLEHLVAVERDREVVVDEDQVIGPHSPFGQPLHGGPAALRLALGRSGRRGEGLPVLHLAEVLDRHLLAVHAQPEISRLEAGHQLAGAVGHHRLEVDDADVDRLAEGRGRVRRSGCGGGMDREGGGEDGEKRDKGAERSSHGGLFLPGWFAPDFSIGASNWF